MPGQFIESQSSIVPYNGMESLKCASLVLHIRIYRSYSWWNFESVTQLIHKKICKQVSEMVHEL